MSAQKLRVGYVPEHFAAPLLKLAETSWGKEHIELVLQPSGTGQMLTSLDASTSGQKIDVAVALTEALITGIAKGRQDYKLVGSYVRTPLNWAVITGTDSRADKYQSIADLRGSTLGISRVGSGSQIMGSVMGLQQQWTEKDLQFQVNDTFENLRKGVNQHEPHATSAFMWEWYTTKPFADSGEVRFIGNVPTPWPSWTIAASTHTALAAPQNEILALFLSKLNESIKEFANSDTRSSGKVKEFIVSHHSYKPEDVESWLGTVRWAGEETPNPSNLTVPSVGQNTTTSTVSRGTIALTLDVLAKAGVVQGDTSAEAFVPSSSTLVD